LSISIFVPISTTVRVQGVVFLFFFSFFLYFFFECVRKCNPLGLTVQVRFIVSRLPIASHWLEPDAAYFSALIIAFKELAASALIE